MTPPNQTPEQQETQRAIKNPAFNILSTIFTILAGLELFLLFGETYNDFDFLLANLNYYVFVPVIVAIIGLLCFKHKFQRGVFAADLALAIALMAYTHFKVIPLF